METYLKFRLHAFIFVSASVQADQNSFFRHLILKVSTN